RHGPLRAEAELAARLLLQSRGREWRRRAARRLLRPDIGDNRPRTAEPVAMLVGRCLIADLRLLAIDPDEVGGKSRTVGGAVGGDEGCFEGPVLACDERPDLPLAIDHDTDGDRLDAAGR